MDYLEKLKDPRWQRKRLEIFERDDWKCRACSSSEDTLCIHHLVYRKSVEPWDIPNGFLITLCELCHSDHKDEDEEENSYGCFLEDVGDVLDSLYRSRLDGLEMCNLAYAIRNCPKPPHTTPDKWDFDIKIKKTKK